MFDIYYVVVPDWMMQSLINYIDDGPTCSSIQQVMISTVENTDAFLRMRIIVQNRICIISVVSAKNNADVRKYLFRGYIPAHLWVCHRRPAP